MKTDMSHLLLVGALGVAIFASSIFVILQSSSMPNHQSAFATFPGENGKIAFTSDGSSNPEISVMNADGTGQTRLTTANRGITEQFPVWSPDGTKIAYTVSINDVNHEIYVMNADGTGQTRLTNNAVHDSQPDWGSTAAPPPELDTTPPLLTVPEDIVVDATTANGGTVVTYNVTAQDDVDGKATLEEDGTTTQDDVGGDISISCKPASGSEFPIGDTTVECSAMDVAGNEGTASFMVTVNPPPPDTTPPVITVPDDITKEATGPDGATVAFEVSAEDDVDGPVGVTCDYNSGDTFPIGETVVTCSAEDAAGNSAEETFTVTVQDTTDPAVEITQVVDRRNRLLEEGDTTPTPYIRVSFEATDAVGVDSTECNLNGQGFTSCTSPVVYDRLSRGTHQVTVRATDEAGNTGEDRFLFTIGNPSSAPGRQ